MARLRKFIFIAVVVAVVIAVSVLITQSFRKQLYTSSASLVQQQAQQAINRCVDGLLNDVDKTKYVNTTSDADGRILSIQLDTHELAKLSAALSVRMTDSLRPIENLTLSLPRGAFLGSGYLADKGRKIDFDVTTTYNVRCSYSVYHKEIGINQVRYAIYMHIVTDADILVPIEAQSRVFNDYFPVCELIYAGTVPDTYIGGEEGLEYLDLLP